MSTENDKTTTLVKAAKALGQSPRQLKEQIQRVEAARGISLLIVGGSQSGRGIRYHVQWSQLREHLPHLFGADDLVHAGEVRQGIASQLGGIAQTLASLRETLDEYGLRLRRLEVRVFE